MPAQLIAVGPPANEAEPLAFRFLQENLPATYTLFTNPTLVNAQGVTREIDAVVAAPHALFAVEVKSWSGRIEGTDHDWYIPHRVPSPVLKTRTTAQMLGGELRKRTHEAGKLWVQGLVFLSHTTQVGDLGPLSRHQVVTRNQVIRALTDPEPLLRQSGFRALSPVTPGVLNELTRLLRPPKREHRQIQAYDLREQLEGTDRYAEYVAVHRMTREERILRVYAIPDDASQERRERLRTRVLWEAQVLRRLGQHKGILDADPPFEDEAGLVLPLERFDGVTLSGWVEKYHKALEAHSGNLAARVGLWERVVDALAYAHDNGVIHRLLRPEAVLVQDRLEDPDIRVTDFDLAKQLASGVTVTWTAVPDERRRWSAPEVLQNFSDADARSDQFSLGALLGYLLCGEPLFQTTADLVREPKLVRRVRDLRIQIPQKIDLAVVQMLQVRPADRFPSLLAARQAVREGLQRSAPVVESRPVVDPDDLQPGQRVGDDYTVEQRIGEGGMGVVYAARHRLSGAVHVLKVAKPGHEDALRAEFQALQRLNHPAIVRPITLSSMVPDRFTLVLERGGTQSLARWLRERGEVSGNALRKLAEDLFAALAYLEAPEQDLVHKDLKPDNLLVTAAGGMTVIDFSAVNAPEDEPFAGTPPYRDPSWRRWTHATDRYAAAICLFELYVGRHPFGGKAPEPDAVPSLDPTEVDPPGLVTFFEQVLHPDPVGRPSSAVAMRSLFLVALGTKVPTPDPDVAEVEATDEIGSDTTLSAVGLSNRATNQLRKSGIRTVGELLSLSDAQIRAIQAIGGKTAREIGGFRDRMLRAGLRPTRPPLVLAEPVLAPLVDDHESVTALRLPAKLTERLVDAGLDTVGKVAASTRDDLLTVKGIGETRVSAVVRALHLRHGARSTTGAPTLELLWDRATVGLTDRQRLILDVTVGVTLAVRSQVELAAELGVTQPTVSRDLAEALSLVDEAAIEGPRAFVEELVEQLGVAVAAGVRDRLIERYPGSESLGEAWVRLLARVAADRLALIEVDEVDLLLVTRAGLTRDRLERFVREAKRQAQWPPADPEGARRALRAVVSEAELPGDPLAIAVRLLPELGLTDRGELFEGPVSAGDALDYVLRTERPPVSIARLQERVTEAFGASAPFPEVGELQGVLQGIGYRAAGDQVVAVDAASVSVDLGPADPVPEALQDDRIGAALEAARGSRGFRLVVAKPATHLAVGRSVAQRLGLPFVSFADRWFRLHEQELDRLVKAERFVAQRARLAKAADATFDVLLAEHGRPGGGVVVGDAGILG
ncbi:MAG: protein kinase, partial [Myxococcota bacterium]